MPHVTLIVNPAAGRASLLARQLPALEALLGRHGYTSQVLYTTAEEDSARMLASSVLAASSLVLACGGDGTVNGVVQGLAHTGTTLGVVPLGTADALAGSLGLPRDPGAALALLLTFRPRLIPLGCIGNERRTRFFVTMAGCGPSAALAHALAAGSHAKSRLGRAAYPLQAARLFLTRRWAAFQVNYRLPRSSVWHTAAAASVLVSRVPSLGGFLSRLTPRATLTSSTLHLQLVRPPAHLSLPAWFVASAAGLSNPWLQTLDVEEFRCAPLPGTRHPTLVRTLVQADAEPLGALPCTCSIVPDALNLLLPPGYPVN